MVDLEELTGWVVPIGAPACCDNRGVITPSAASRDKAVLLRRGRRLVIIYNVIGEGRTIHTDFRER